MENSRKTAKGFSTMQLLATHNIFNEAKYKK